MASNWKYTDTEKWCPRCEQMLPHEAFNQQINKAKGLQTYCRKCQVAYGRANPARRGKTSKITNLTNRLKSRYDMTLEDFDMLVEKQDGSCAICGTADTGRYGRFSVDHNHETGQIRDLLCVLCNSWLSHIENREWLLLATAYLKKHEESSLAIRRT